jgi:hypothetical protein
MFEEITKHIKIMSELKIDVHQYLLCYLLHIDRDDKKAGLPNVYRYSTIRQWKKNEVQDLVDKGILQVTSTGKTKLDADCMIVTEKFTNLVFASLNRFEQLMSIYPKTLPAFDGSSNRWKTMACDIDALEEQYNKIVKTQALHTKIIELTQWAVDNNQINTNFDNYVRGRQWLAIEELKDKYTVSTGNNMHVAKD